MAKWVLPVGQLECDTEVQKNYVGKMYRVSSSDGVHIDKAEAIEDWDGLPESFWGLDATPTEGRKDDGYDSLRYVLTLAIEQANAGKGKERHANGKPFDRQPIMEIGRMVGSGYPLGQAMKKAQESTRLPPDRAKAELLGAINYLAAAYMLLD